MCVLFIILVIYVIFYFISSPFLFVYGDDRVIRYTGADVDIGDAEDAQATEWGLARIKARDFHYVIIYVLDFGICKVLILRF